MAWEPMPRTDQVARLIPANRATYRAAARVQEVASFPSRYESPWRYAFQRMTFPER
jgi:hypothetical protein